MPKEKITTKKPSTEEQRAAWRLRKTQSLKLKAHKALLQERVVGGLVMPGEWPRPGQDATNVADALVVARLFLRAAGKPDVQAGESLLDVERRAFDAWIESGLPLLQIQSGTFSTVFLQDTGKSFDAIWIPLPGATEPLSAEMLTTLPFSSESIRQVMESQSDEGSWRSAVPLDQQEGTAQYWKRVQAERRAAEDRHAMNQMAEEIERTQQQMNAAETRHVSFREE